MWDKITHKWLRAPYFLNAREYQHVKRPTATIILLHGVGSSLAMWEPLIKKMPKHVRIIALDLIGFGGSPKPTWATYNVRAQARSVATTLFYQNISGPVVVVGHSLGSLIAIEFARRYPVMVKDLVLISPPLYDPLYAATRLELQPRDIVQSIYDAIEKNQTDTGKLLKVISKYYVVNKGVSADNINVPILLESIKSSIINQTSYRDIQALRQPIYILTGKLDPFVSEKTIKILSGKQPSVSWQSILASHEISGPLLTATARTIAIAIDKAIQPSSKHGRNGAVR